METPISLSQEPSSTLKGKGFGVRAGAYIIDAIVIAIASFAISFIIGIILGIVFVATGRNINFADGRSTGLNILVGIILSTLYFIIFEWLYGATPGKLILSMRVIMEDGKPCSLGAATIRALLRYVDGFFFGIPALSSMKEPLLQRIGDRSAKTIVVGSKDSYIQQPREWWWFLLASAAYLGLDTITVVVQLLVALR